MQNSQNPPTPSFTNLEDPEPGDGEFREQQARRHREWSVRFSHFHLRDFDAFQLSPGLDEQLIEEEPEEDEGGGFSAHSQTQYIDDEDRFTVGDSQEERSQDEEQQLRNQEINPFGGGDYDYKNDLDEEEVHSEEEEGGFSPYTETNETSGLTQEDQFSIGDSEEDRSEDEGGDFRVYNETHRSTEENQFTIRDSEHEVSQGNDDDHSDQQSEQESEEGYHVLGIIEDYAGNGELENYEPNTWSQESNSDASSQYQQLLDEQNEEVFSYYQNTDSEGVAYDATDPLIENVDPDAVEKTEAEIQQVYLDFIYPGSARQILDSGRIATEWPTFVTARPFTLVPQSVPTVNFQYFMMAERNASGMFPTSPTPVDGIGSSRQNVGSWGLDMLQSLAAVWRNNTGPTNAERDLEAGLMNGEPVEQMTQHRIVTSRELIPGELGVDVGPLLRIQLAQMGVYVNIATTDSESNESVSTITEGNYVDPLNDPTVNNRWSVAESIASNRASNGSHRSRWSIASYASDTSIRIETATAIYVAPAFPALVHIGPIRDRLQQAQHRAAQAEIRRLPTIADLSVVEDSHGPIRMHGAAVCGTLPTVYPSPSRRHEESWANQWLQWKVRMLFQWRWYKTKYGRSFLWACVIISLAVLIITPSMVVKKRCGFGDPKC